MRAGLILFLLAGTLSLHATDSCDIGIAPAATLLLPYFEVAPEAGGETTIVTVTNVGRLPQVARVTLWTDYAFPVFGFDVYLTGYDVQSINLHDVIFRGRVAPPFGTGSNHSPIGPLSGLTPTREHNNPRLDEGSCALVPAVIEPALVQRMTSAFTTGRGCGTATIGDFHENAVGYATIDVVGRCGLPLPVDPEYFATGIRYDNVLIGDYLQVDPDEDQAQGNTLVHIRAMAVGTFDRTFYGHLQPAGVSDRRQPLPQTFATHWISGGRLGYETSFKIWRGVTTRADAACPAYARNDEIKMMEIARFDDEENVEVAYEQWGHYLPAFALPATSLVDIGDHVVMPPSPHRAVTGWMYFNLVDNRQGLNRPAQNWVVVSMRAEDRFSVDIDAASLGNGCSPFTNFSEALGGDRPIGPAPNRP